MKKLRLNKKITRYIMLFLAAAIYAVGVNFFLTPAHLMAAGVTGISQIIVSITAPFVNLSLGTIILLLNVPLLILAYFKLSKHFAIRTIFVTISTSLLINVIPVVTITTDPILCAIFAGVLFGIATALQFSNGGSGGGIDIVAGVARKSNPNLSIGSVYNVVNIGVFLVSGFLFGWTIVLYSIVCAFVNSIAIDKLFLNAKRITAMIVTNKGDEVGKVINEELIRGATIIDGRGSFTHEHKNILMITTSRDELARLRRLIYKVDEHAFVTLLQTASVYGNFEQKDL